MVVNLNYAGGDHNMITVNALEARRHLGRILDRMDKKKEGITIERKGRPIAVLVPVSQYRDPKERMWEAASRLDEVRRSLGRWRGEPAQITIRKFRESR